MASDLKSAVANFDAKASHGESSSTQIHLPSVDARVTSADPHEKVHPALGNSPLSPVESQPNLCAVVLAGGDGKRLQSFVRHVRGSRLPKQYVNFVGIRSLLEHTLDRTKKLVFTERIFTVVNGSHLKFPDVEQQLSRYPRMTVVEQPANKDTGPGVLLAFMHVQKRFPESTVAVFPSDHFIMEDQCFISHVDRAGRLVAQDPARMVLLGIEPREPDSEYGYIVPGRKIEGSSYESLRTVELFVEKPPVEQARRIIARGALWNTLVMVCSCKTLIEIYRRKLPECYHRIELIRNVIGTHKQRWVADQVYQDLSPINFSTDILEALPVENRKGLSVLPVRGVQWSDWGNERRLREILKKIDVSDIAGRFYEN